MGADCSNKRPKAFLSPRRAASTRWPSAHGSARAADAASPCERTTMVVLPTRRGPFNWAAWAQKAGHEQLDEAWRKALTGVATEANLAGIVDQSTRALASESAPLAQPDVVGGLRLLARLQPIALGRQRLQAGAV